MFSRSFERKQRRIGRDVLQGVSKPDVALVMGQLPQQDSAKSCAMPVIELAPATREIALRGMTIAGHGLDLISSVLGLPHLLLVALLRRSGLSEPTTSRQRVNRHPRAWTGEQYRLLIHLWLTDQPARSIAEQLDRSASSVYRKRRFLNLPTRQRINRKMRPGTQTDVPSTTSPLAYADAPSVLPSAPEVISLIPAPAAMATLLVRTASTALPHDVAICMPLENRIGSSWLVRNSPTDLILHAHRSRPQTSWKTNIEAQYELGLRHLCGQRPEKAAADLAVTDKSVSSVWSKIGLGRRIDIPYVDDFDPEMAVMNMRKFEFEFIPDPNMVGWRQWRHRKSSQRLSRLFRKSVRYRNAQASL